MTEEERMRMVRARTGDYLYIMRTALFVLLGVGIALHFGEGYSSVLVMLAISAAAFGIIAGGVALDDMAALRDGMDEACAKTPYGTGVKGRNFATLKMISGVLVGLTGLAAVLAVFL